MKDNRETTNNSEISTNRKILFYLGTIMIALGYILFFSVFFTTFNHMFRSFGHRGANFYNAFIGIIMIAVGTGLRTIGSRGLSGSGLLLNPTKAREDLKPHSKAIGGMIGDALEEVDLLNKKSEVIIKLKCGTCGAINDEDATFCSSCGNRL